MRIFSSTEVARRFRFITRRVQTEPVRVQTRGRDQMVLLSPAEYVRPRRRDRKVFSTSDMPHVVRDAIAQAQPSAQAAGFDDEMEI